MLPGTTSRQCEKHLTPEMSPASKDRPQSESTQGGVGSGDLLGLWIHRHNQARIAFDNTELWPAWPADWLTRKAGPMPLDLLGDRDRIDRKHAQAVANLHAVQRGGNMRRQKKWWGVIWKYYRLQRIRGHAIWVRRYSWPNK